MAISLFLRTVIMCNHIKKYKWLILLIAESMRLSGTSDGNIPRMYNSLMAVTIREDPLS